MTVSDVRMPPLAAAAKIHEEVQDVPSPERDLVRLIHLDLVLLLFLGIEQ